MSVTISLPVLPAPVDELWHTLLEPRRCYRVCPYARDDRAALRSWVLRLPIARCSGSGPDNP